MWPFSKSNKEENPEENYDIKCMVVGSMVVVYINGKQYQKTFSSLEDAAAFYKLSENTDPKDEKAVELLKSFVTMQASKEELNFLKEQEDENQQVLEFNKEIEILEEWALLVKDGVYPELEIVNDQLCMTGINIPMPTFLAKQFMYRSQKQDQSDYKSLLNFWRLLALNPDAKCREDLYRFLDKHKMVVTPAGYFVAYRNVAVKKNAQVDNLELFVGESIVKVKSWKKGTKHFSVLKNKETGDYKLWDNRKKTPYNQQAFDYVGKLDKLNEDVVATDREAIYTDNHTRTMDIRIGTPVQIDRGECDPSPDRECSNGLHLGNPSFMRQGAFGGVGLVCICNPMHVVAVPYRDGRKLRCCEYLPVGVAEYNDDGSLKPLNVNTFLHEYQEFTAEQIESMINNAEFEFLTEHRIVPKELKEVSLDALYQGFAASIDEMEEIVNNRVVEI